MKILIDGKEYIEKDAKTDNNSGDRNSGNCNSGYGNSGYRNSGDWNSGDRNSGYGNSGDRNSGDCNSGYGNSGYRNSGDCNSGDRNSGYGNSGDRNSGDWNSGNWNSGYLNTDKPKIRIFNKETTETEIDFPSYFYFNLTEFVETEQMTDEEKKKYPHYAVTTGFLRVFDYKTAWLNSFNKATKEDVAKTLELPNFNAQIFEEITEITKKMLDEKIGGK